MPAKNNSMKRKASSLLILLFTAIQLTFAGGTPDKLQAKNILIRTNRVIGHAQMSVKRGGNYSGDLSKAVAHARVAKKLFNDGNYLRAIQHSRLARIDAVQAIKANKVKLPMDASFTTQETELFGDLPSDEDLNKEALQLHPETLKDQDLMNGNLNIEFVQG